jgi:hypothetical protein
VLSQLGRHTVAIEHARAALVILQAELFGEDGCVCINGWQWLGDSGWNEQIMAVILILVTCEMELY